MLSLTICANVGETSPVVETQFGFHIIRLAEHVPEQRMSFEDRRIAFIDTTYEMRAKEAQSGRLAELRKTTRVDVNASAERIMRSVTNPAEAGGREP